MKRLRLLVFALALSFAAPALPDPGPADTEFDKVADEYIKGWLAAHPITATQLGIHDFDGRISDFTRLSLDAELSRLKRFDDRLKRFDATKLSAERARDLRVLHAAVRKDLFEFQATNAFENNPMVYAQAIDVNVYIKRNFAPLEERVRSIITIENQVPNIMIAAKTNLAPVLPRPFVELAIQIARGNADFLKKDLVEALKDVKDEKLRNAFQLSNRKAWMALSEYATWLERDRLPKAIAEWPLGEQKYRQMLAETELLNMEPAKVLEIGVEELKREQASFEEAAKIIDPTRPAHEVFKDVKKDHPTPESLIPDTAKNLEAIREFVVKKDLVTIPSKERAKVDATPKFARATSFASMDTPGPFEKKAAEAYYYVTPTEPEWPDQQKEEWLTAFNYYTTDVVSIHEAYPGHYTQFLHLNASSVSRVAKIFSSYAFVEGWAHYTEKVLIDAGYGSSTSATPSEDEVKRAAKYRMAQADEALLRLCRLIASIKMHTQGMTVDEATRFFMDNCHYEEKPARSEAMRGTYDPGYLNYTLGKLMILKLRKDYEAQEGANFSAKKFHDELLKHGMPPVPILREILLKDKAKWPEVL
ncbi:MAG: hypothetical protein AVDCRST_MAG42-1992 [uncultured Chthoniobacterales bacterium]|uniref:DUF885 domain-containing protein n=1 Tax=uncultured Chthoniobacterales bacterium TaxID=1836801 RepID=A0A6J4ICC7_9BACT|nr:MAG: hypothetical protein AVDCRST_MAG42-1992 [uncultured Chthoniobacterales bacterium]